MYFNYRLNENLTGQKRCPELRALYKEKKFELSLTTVIKHILLSVEEQFYMNKCKYICFEASKIRCDDETWRVIHE
jgi:hypothetical protein